jgi:septal ring factor EnvC (AmiA/AmiB activator)
MTPDLAILLFGFAAIIIAAIIKGLKVISNLKAKVARLQELLTKQADLISSQSAQIEDLQKINDSAREQIVELQGKAEADAEKIADLKSQLDQIPSIEDVVDQMVASLEPGSVKEPMSVSEVIAVTDAARG